MLDVHPPEHGLHGTRDFIVHLLTITIGLLIALGLENSVEAWHHRHQREHAEAMIRQEISENRESLKSSVRDVIDEYKDLQAATAFVTARSQGVDVPVPKLKLLFKEGNIPDSAWRTASSTGALSYMKYEEVQKFSEVYKEQDLLQRTAEQTLDDYLQVGPLVQPGQDVSKLSQKDAADMLPLLRRAQGHLGGMLAIGKGTLDTYNDALKMPTK